MYRFYWLENNKIRHSKGSSNHQQQHSVSSAESSGPNNLLSSSKYSSSTIPFSPGAMFTGLAAQHPMGSSLSSSMAGSPFNTFSPASHAYGASPAASMIFSHNNQHSSHTAQLSQTPPTPSLLSAFSANTLLRADRLRLIASMFSQMCEAVAVCHEAGISHRDIKPENFICCDSIELETLAENEARALGNADGHRGGFGEFGPQAKRKVVVKLTDFGLATTDEDCDDMACGSKPYMSYGMSRLVLKETAMLTDRMPERPCRPFVPTRTLRCVVAWSRPTQHDLSSSMLERGNGRELQIQSIRPRQTRILDEPFPRYRKSSSLVLGGPCSLSGCRGPSQRQRLRQVDQEPTRDDCR